MQGQQLETPVLLETHQCSSILLLNSTAIIPHGCGGAWLRINAIHAT